MDGQRSVIGHISKSRRNVVCAQKAWQNILLFQFYSLVTDGLRQDRKKNLTVPCIAMLLLISNNHDKLHKQYYES